MDGRRHENAFAHFRWKLENRVGNVCACSFIKQTVFSLARSDAELVGAYHIIEYIGIYAGGIDDGFCKKSLLLSGICMKG